MSKQIKLHWLDAIAQNSKGPFYLWGASGEWAKWKDFSRTFEVEELTEPPAEDEVFVIQLTDREHNFVDQWRRCISTGTGSMYAQGGHRYPMPTDRPLYRIVRWVT